MINKSPLILLALSLIVSLWLAACEQPTAAPPTPMLEPTLVPTLGAIELTDGRGRTFSVEAPFQRIVSLAPSNTEILFAIGAGAQIAGRDSYSDFPSEAQEAVDVGGVYGDLNFETIVSIEPDLVLAANLTPPEQIEALEDLGMNVFVLSNPTDFDGLYINLFTVAQLTGHEEEAIDLIGRLKARVAAVEEKVAIADERPLVFYELDGSEPDAPWTSGPGTFIDTLIAMAGGENMGHALEGEWVQISAEELITQNPDVILLGDYTWGGVTPEDVAARAGWDILQAVKSGQVHTFDDNLVSRPGPRLVEGLEAMAILLHPDLFE